jgi:transposase
MRTLADLPWSGYRVAWRLRVRKLFCRNAICPRRIFTERLPGVVAPWARRTVRLMAHLLAVALALGGAAGVRLSRHFGLLVSRNTLLRLIRRAPWPAISSLQVLSVDDFALRKRHIYGTLLQPNGCGHILGSRWSSGIARKRMRKRPVWGRPWPSRWRIGSTCCRTSRTC